MDDFFECRKIESTFKNDELNFPRKGKCKIQDSNLVLLFIKDNFNIDQNQNEFKTVSHNVKVTLFSIQLKKV